MNTPYVDNRVLKITQLIKTYSLNFIEETKLVIIKPKRAYEISSDFENLFKQKEPLLLLPSSGSATQISPINASFPNDKIEVCVKEQNLHFINRNIFKIEDSIFL